MERAPPMLTRVEHSEYCSIRNLVWGYPVSLGSMSKDWDGGGKKRKHHSYLPVMLCLFVETWNTGMKHW